MNNSQLVYQALPLLEQLNSNQPTLTTLGVVAHLLHHTPTLQSRLVAPRKRAEVMAQANILYLFRQMESLFNQSEIKNLCFEMGVDYEELAGEGKGEKIRELITYCQRRGRVSDLIRHLESARPHATWQNTPPVSLFNQDEIEIESRLHIAVVVAISRPNLTAVAQYFDRLNLEAYFVVCQSSQPDQPLSAENSWEGHVKAFADTMAKLKTHFAGAQTHFFLAAPGALLFTLGAVWGTVDDAMIYHYEKGNYYAVATTSRRLK